MNRLLRALAALFVVVQLAGCGFFVIHGIKYAWGEQKKREGEVGAALERYRVRVLEMQPAQIAAMFDPDGEISHDDGPAVVGHEAILAFFNSFAEYKVLEYELHTDSASPRGRAFEQKGTYRQKVTLPSGETAVATGRFEASWSRGADDRWVISRMHTASIAAGDSG